MNQTVQETLAAAEEALARAGVESARHDAEVLLAAVLDLPPNRLPASVRLSSSQSGAFATALARRVSREPLQHITGVAGFRYLDLVVGPGVFVPRPETEIMTGAAVEELRRLTRCGVERPCAVDLCTGSGAVAASLASEVPGSSVTAVELSPEAYAYAVRNTREYDVDVRLGDMADAVEDLAGSVHVVTANPPYIPLTAFESVAPEARDFDPPVALWSGEDGLDAIRTVAAVAADLLVDGGLLVCEHADAQGESAPAVLLATGLWVEVRDHPDLSVRSRYVTARRVARARTPTGTIAV